LRNTNKNEQAEAIHQRTDNTTEKGTKGQTIISKALHRIQSLRNTKPYITEGQTIQAPKGKRKKDKSTKHCTEN
jgi:hypothetical protein